MFQTVGHNVVVGLSECMALPLFRTATEGVAKVTGVEYGADPETSSAGREKERVRGDGDEVTDLLRLLAAVKAAMPHVQAVISGAILSNYQRHRVEHV
jgi:diphthine-ammonia ligase